MEFKDYYKTLGVARGASPDEIKRAYRKLARRFHPDVSKERGAEDRFKEIGEAHEALKDPEKRAAYDALGADIKAGQEFRPPPGWEAQYERGGASSDAEAAAFSDFFETLFARSHGTRRAPHDAFRARGADHHAKAPIDVEDAYRGATRTISLRAAEPGDDGRVHLRERRLNVRIPKCVRQGQHVRLRGQGGAGSGGGPAGDLYLEIEINPHSIYRVEGKDVFVDLPVAPWEAALGRKIEAPTPDGPVKLEIPAGSQTGRKLRLKGRGIPGEPPGDLYVVLRIVLPPADSDAARAIYREMEAKFAFDPRTKLGG